MLARRLKFPVAALSVQVAIGVLFAIFLDYDADANAKYKAHNMDPTKGGQRPEDNSFKDYYPAFQDIHVMRFFGVGYLLVFMKKYGYTAVSMNFLMGAVSIQWSMLMQGYWRMKNGKILVDLISMVRADFASAAVLISMGAVLGKLNPLQLLLMTMVEITIYAANEYLTVDILQVTDNGGGIYLHVFAGFFGLAISFAMYRKEVANNPKESSNYISDLFSMAGTIFLWTLWPSFNAVLIIGDGQNRGVLNTYIALASSCVTTFAISAILDKKGRFSMMHIQNATLAGGVTIGTLTNYMVYPYGALFVGISASLVCCLGFHYITPILTKYCRLHDTCGVNNLHVMPGILAGLYSALVAYYSSEDNYGLTLYEVFPARAPLYNTTELKAIQAKLPRIVAGQNRTAYGQAMFQLIAVAIAVGVGIVGGLITGLVSRLPFFDTPTGAALYDDASFWIMQKESDEENGIIASPITITQSTKF